MMKIRGHFWHMSCDSLRMAKKMNTLRLEHVDWGQAEFPNRRSTMEPAALYLMQVRASRMKISPLKKRLSVLVDAETHADVPCPVKIKHTV
jgi:hypothetical protein